MAQREYFLKFGPENQKLMTRQMAYGLGVVEMSAILNDGYKNPAYTPQMMVDLVDERAGRCRSPIEAFLAIELAFLEYTWPLVDAGNRVQDSVQSWFQPQFPVGKYLVDLMVCLHVGGRRCFSVAVECDGHDYHERTKEQAAHDRARDRALLILGTPTLRFTGSEIFKSPRDCALQVAEFLATKVPDPAGAA